MHRDNVTYHANPRLRDARMVLGFAGWMDGGEVSTGTVEHLAAELGAARLAEIDAEPFYLYSFPGSMEIAALFRPHCVIEEGLIRRHQEPENVFHYSAEHHLVLFSGKEPHFGWRTFADNLLEVASRCDVQHICFIGSVAAIVPHRRDTRMHASVSDARMLPTLEKHHIQPSNYEGPASFVTYLTGRAAAQGIRMMNLVAEIPAYVQGRNMKCIESVVRKLDAVWELGLEFDALAKMSLEFEHRMELVIKEHPDLAEIIRKIERDYDREDMDSHAEDLREWFEKQNLRFD